MKNTLDATLVKTVHDPKYCNTQEFFDRDVNLLRCDEPHNCKFKRYYNRMVICDCPAARNLSH